MTEYSGMTDQLPDVQAAQLLESVRQSRVAMRRAIRAHRGHWYMWVWGLIWLIYAVLGYYLDIAALAYINALAIAGTVASFLIASIQRSKIRASIDRRFVAALGALLLFGYLAPVILGVYDATSTATFVRVFAYFALLWIQPYILAGLWFRISFLLWIGLLISLSILLGLLVFSAIFWVWFAIFAAMPLILSGFYVRYFLRCNSDPSDG
jgi:hypothetical protein